MELCHQMKDISGFILHELSFVVAPKDCFCPSSHVQNASCDKTIFSSHNRR